MTNRISSAIQTSQGDSREVLISAIKAVKKFDTEIDTINRDIERASESCGDLLHWLFLATKIKIYLVLMTACCDVQIQIHFKNIERIYLNQNQPAISSNNRTLPINQDGIQRLLEKKNKFFKYN